MKAEAEKERIEVNGFIFRISKLKRNMLVSKMSWKRGGKKKRRKEKKRSNTLWRLLLIQSSRIRKNKSGPKIKK